MGVYCFWPPLNGRTWRRFCCSCWCCIGRLSSARAPLGSMLAPWSVGNGRPANIGLLFFRPDGCYSWYLNFHSAPPPSVRACQALLVDNSRGRRLLQTWFSPPRMCQNPQGLPWQPGSFCTMDVLVAGTPPLLSTRGFAARERPFASHLGSCSCQNCPGKGLPTALAL